MVVGGEGRWGGGIGCGRGDNDDFWGFGSDGMGLVIFKGYWDNY